MDYSNLDIQPVKATEVYLTENLFIAIKQEKEDDGYQTIDPVILFPVEYADRIITAIQREVQRAEYEQTNS